MKQTIVVLLITMLCACGTMSSEISLKEKNDKWIGLAVDDLIVANGEPANVYTIEKGGRMFEYVMQRKEKEKIRRRVNPNAVNPYTINLYAQDISQGPAPREFAGEVSGGDRIARIRAARKAKRMESDQGCTILFKISASDIVVGWLIEGEKCD